jgi:hypothetical protein
MAQEKVTFLYRDLEAAYPGHAVNLPVDGDGDPEGAVAVAMTRLAGSRRPKRAMLTERFADLLAYTAIAADDEGPSDADDGRDVEVMELHAGPAVRVRTLVEPLPETGGQMPATTNLDIHVPVPGSGGYLLLSFSTRWSSRSPTPWSSCSTRCRGRSAGRRRKRP